MAVEEDGGGREGAGTGSNYGGGGGDGGDDARRLTVEDRADLWEWFEEFIEDLCMDVAKVMSVRAEHRGWTRAHGMGEHEAAASTATAAAAAAAAAASSAPGPGGGDPLQAPNAPESRSDNKNGSHGRKSHGKAHAGAGASRTVAPPANPQQRLNAGAGGGAPDVGNSGGALFTGGAGAAVGSGAGVAGVHSLAAAGAAGMVGMWAGGGLMALPGDQQRRDQWSPYYQQQQQQQQHQQQVSNFAMRFADIYEPCVLSRPKLFF